MKFLILIFVFLSLLGCGGPSDKEKQDVADSTCAILKETAENQNAFRVKELNAARATIGEKPFVDGDEIIQDSIRFGLCNSLVINSPDFNQKYASKLEYFRAEVAINTCEELDLSYALGEVSEDDKDDYLLSQSRGYHNKEYSEFINQKKLTTLNIARQTLREPAFSGSASNINKYQFFGLCQSLVKNDMGNAEARYQTYEDTVSDIAHKNFLKNSILLNNENNPYALLFDDKESEINLILINLFSKEEVSDIDFYGSIVSTDDDYSFISKFKYAVEIKNKIPVIIEVFYPSNQLKFQTKFQPSGAISSQTNWYINGLKSGEHIYKDGFLSSVTKWDLAGELYVRRNYKKGIPHGIHEIFLGGELWTQTPYKDGKKDGIQKSWNVNGKLEELTTFKNGNKDGVYKKWGRALFSQNDAWELLEQSFYKDDLKHGTETKWSIKEEGGTYIREKNNYLNGKLHGESVSYYSDGKLDERITYFNGSKHGIYEKIGLFTKNKKVCYQNDEQVKLEVCNPKIEPHEQKSLNATITELQTVSLPVDTCEKPSPVVKVAPIYPRRALNKGISGWVDLSYTVNRLGSVENVVVVDSSDSMFDRAAIKAMEKWKFKPVFCNGELQKFDMTNRMNFDIE